MTIPSWRNSGSSPNATDAHRSRRSSAAATPATSASENGTSVSAVYERSLNHGWNHSTSGTMNSSRRPSRCAIRVVSRTVAPAIRSDIIRAPSRPQRAGIA
jgi:hypothetical protein